LWVFAQHAIALEDDDKSERLAVATETVSNVAAMKGTVGSRRTT